MWARAALGVALAATAQLTAAQQYPQQYNVQWRTPTNEPGKSEDGYSTYQGAMPVGNGATTVLAWPNVTTGGVALYIGNQNAMSTQTELMKLGLIQIALSPNPYQSGAYFNQTLDLLGATVTVLAGGSNRSSYAVAFSIYVDANSDTVLISAAARDPTQQYSLSVSWSSLWPGTVTNYSVPFSCMPGVRVPDVAVDPLPAPFPAPAATLVTYKRNDVSVEGSMIDFTLALQGLSSIVDSVQDVWTNLTYGMAIDGGAGPALQRLNPTTLVSAAAASSFNVRITLLIQQTPDAATWLNNLAGVLSERPVTAAAEAERRRLHDAYWTGFWGRSHIIVNGSQTASSPNNHAAAGWQSDWWDPAADLSWHHHLHSEDLAATAAATVAAALAAIPTDQILWLKADTLTLQDGQAVASWPDAVNAANNAVQSNAALQPTYRATGLDGMPAVQFDGVKTFLEGSLSFPSESSIFAVFKDTGSVSVCCNGVFFAVGACNGISTAVRPGGGSDDDDAPAAPGGNTTVLMLDWAGSGELGQQNIANKSIVAATVYGSGGAFTAIGTCPQVQDATSHGVSATSYMVGTRNNELQRFLKGYISEILVYPRAVSAAEQAAIVSYLESKWNLTAPKCHAVSGDGFRLSQQYALTRFVQAIQSRTTWPIKFNGMAFVANMGSNGEGDFRQWGPSNWWQNTRLMYGYNMLAAGDFDTFSTVLKYIGQMTDFAAARTLTYFNHTGVYFTETKHIFGAYATEDYGCAGTRPSNYPVWLENSDWIHLDFSGDGGTQEMALAILDYYLFTGDAATLQQYLPFCTLAADFFRQHYTNRTENGTYVFWPAQALETWWCSWDSNTGTFSTNCCADDMPAVVGNRVLLTKLLALPQQFTTPAQRAEWTAFLALLPQLPVTADGSALAPARILSSGTHNSETPELYATHPYRWMTVGRNLTGAPIDLQLAINAWQADGLAHSNQGWNQGGINAALLGLTTQAAAMLIERATGGSAPGYRFPGFSPHYQDYEPSANHLANYMTAFNHMLLSIADDGFEAGTMVLFPAWPCDWDVDFTLWGPLNTTVSVSYVNGSLVSLDVQPPNRKSAIIAANCVTL